MPVIHASRPPSARDERRDLRDREVEVGLRLPEPLAVRRLELLVRRALEDLDRRAVALLDLAPVRVRLREEIVRVDREDARLRLEPEQHVEEDRLLLLERARERDLARELLEQPAERLAPRVHGSTSGRAGSPRSTSFNVSPRSPSRSVSSGITSSGGMLPRLTDGPNCLMNQACAAFDGASKTTFSTPTALAISPISSVRMPPDESKMPAVPPSRASVITFHAPASSSSRSHCVHSSARVLDRRVLRADLGEDGEVAREVGDQLELALARDVDRAVGDLDVRDAELAAATACTRRAASLHVDDLEERAADHDGLVASARRACARGSASRTRCPSRA